MKFLKCASCSDKFTDSKEFKINDEINHEAKKHHLAWKNKNAEDQSKPHNLDIYLAHIEWIF